MNPSLVGTVALYANKILSYETKAGLFVVFVFRAYRRMFQLTRFSLFFYFFYFFNLLTLRTVTKKLANAPLSKVSNLMIWQWELMENRYVGDLPSELSGSERSESDGTFRIDANRPGSDGTKPSSSASEANSCFMYFAIIIITPPPLRLPHPPRIPDVPLASR